MSGIQELYRLADVAAGTSSVMMLFPLGDWTSAKYADLTLTQELADSVIANFESEVLRRKVPVESVGTHDGSSPAGGWVDRVYMAPFEWGGVQGEALYADWTPNARGAQLVNDGQYLYDSVELGSHVDPVTGDETINVLKAVALTNRPVLSLMPSVKDAGSSVRLAEPVEIALSEVTLAAEPDPVAELCDKVDELLAEMSTALKGKLGVPDIRTMLRAVKAKAGAHKLADDGSFDELREDIAEAIEATIPSDAEVWIRDFGPSWAVYTVCVPPAYNDELYRVDWTQDPDDTFTLGAPQAVEAETTYTPVNDGSPEGSTDASSTALSPDMKATEGRPVVLADGDAATKGSDPMKTVATKLNLAEDAPEALVLAEVVKLAEHDAAETKRADAAELQLAEVGKAKRAGEVEVELAEIVKVGNLTPGEKPEFVTLAEEKPDVYAARVAERKALPEFTKINLGEIGSGTEGDDGSRYKDASVELAEKAKARAKADRIRYAEAEPLVLAEDPALSKRYDGFRSPRKEA